MPYDPRMMQQMGQMGIGMMGPPQQGGQPANSPKQPSLYDMMLNLGRMTRPQYDQAIRGPGAYGVSPQTAGRAGPMAFLGSLGLPSGPGWGGGR